ncbi:hypothetical protein SeMB42_g06085 [Synchytrium endobioticum]|uniref:UBC core domain-containing protein n=1 Tax=Synchytrium endobioticum TaxID=286115 RepID=A0A507CKJ3_9FUNG|nr:hypothetical protein SeMB42_g06085 [Synchytrium endobioticum]
MSNIFTKRLTKELKDLETNPPQGIKVFQAEDDLRMWIIGVEGAPGTLYAGEAFKLQFKFGPNYPLESPEVVFVDNVPIHPHVKLTIHSYLCATEFSIAAPSNRFRYTATGTSACPSYTPIGHQL